jgi:hypothetical protein
MSSSTPLPRYLRQEVAEVARAAEVLVQAHKRRNQTSDYATLGEDEGIAFLRERLASIERRAKRRG